MSCPAELFIRLIFHVITTTNILTLPHCDRPISKSNLAKHAIACARPVIIKPKKDGSGHNSWHKKLLAGEAHVWNKGKTITTHPEFAEKLRAGRVVVSAKYLSGDLTPHVMTPEQRKAKSVWRLQYHIDYPESHPIEKKIINNIIGLPGSI